MRMGRQKRFLRHHPGLRHAITHYDRLGFALGVVLVAALAVPVAGYLMLASTFIGIDWLWRKMAPVSYRKFFDWPLAYTFGMIGGGVPPVHRDCRRRHVDCRLSSDETYFRRRLLWLLGTGHPRLDVAA